MTTFEAVHPAGHGCGSCDDGTSVPFDQVDDRTLAYARAGFVRNESGEDVGPEQVGDRFGGDVLAGALHMSATLTDDIARSALESTDAAVERAYRAGRADGWREGYAAGKDVMSDVAF